jgi:hypothetical protein
MLMKFMGIPNRRQHPSYSPWLMMRARCNTPGATGFEHYGGRGIRVCDRWASFEAFVEDMGERPSPQHTIERADELGHYEPGNCRWATRLEQARNRPSYNRLDLEKVRELRRRNQAGESIRSLVREMGLPYSTVRTAIQGDTWKEGAE